MQYTIEFGGDPQDVTLTTSGTASIESFQQLGETLVGDARFEPGMLILIDHSHLDVESLTTADVATIARGVVRLDTGGRSVAAVVAPEPAAFGLNRMSAMLVEESTLTVEVFHSREAALEWLREIKRSRSRRP